MPFFWLGCSAVLGTIIASWAPVPWWNWLLVSLAVSVLFALQYFKQTFPQKRQLPILVAIAVLCLAGCLYSGKHNPSASNHILAYLDSGDVEISGTVSSPPKNQMYNLAVVVDAATIRLIESEQRSPSLPVSGKILLRLPLDAQLAYGDEVSVRGELTEPPEGSDFSYRDYLGHQGIYSMMYYPWVKTVSRGGGSPFQKLIYRLSDFAKATVDQLFETPENALLKGILLGDQSSLPAELKHAYTLTGTAHIIAISGFNMAVLATVVSRLTRKIHLVPAGLITITVLAFYTLLVGASASVVRAAIMCSYVILGYFFGRRGNLLNSLGFCVLVMVLLDPHAAWDVGFQLSVVATLGLSIYMSPMQARLKKWLLERYGESIAERWSEPISTTFLVTLIAQASVLPLLLYHFREISPLFLIANPFILPVQPLLMVTGLVSLLIGMIWFPLGNLIKWVPWIVARYTNWMVSLLSSWQPEGIRISRLDWLWVILFYLIVAWLTLRPSIRGQLKPVFHPLPAVSSLLIGVVVVWTTLGSLPTGDHQLTTFPSATRPIVLLTGRHAESILIGGAMPPRALAEHISASLPPYRQYLNAVIIPVCKKADVKGLFGLEARFSIDTVYWACDPDRIQTTQRLFSEFKESKIPQVILQPSEQILFGETGRLTFAKDSAGEAIVHVRLNVLECMVVYGKTYPTVFSTVTLLSRSHVRSSESSAPLSGVAIMLNEIGLIEEQSIVLDTVGFSRFELVLDGFDLFIKKK